MMRVRPPLSVSLLAQFAIAPVLAQTAPVVGDPRVPQVPIGSVVSPGGPLGTSPPLKAIGRPAAGVAELEMVRKAVDALAAGDAQPLAATFSEALTWDAVATRGLTPAASLNYRGAVSYVDLMARTIRDGTRAFELLSLTPQGDRVVVVSRWLDRGGGVAQQCAAVVTIVGGRVVAVAEKQG